MSCWCWRKDIKKMQFLIKKETQMLNKINDVTISQLIKMNLYSESSLVEEKKSEKDRNFSYVSLFVVLSEASTVTTLRGHDVPSSSPSLLRLHPLPQDNDSSPLCFSFSFLPARGDSDARHWLSCSLPLLSSALISMSLLTRWKCKDDSPSFSAST